MSRLTNVFADYEIVPGSATMYREGGSYACKLIDRNGEKFELVFPIITERLNWRRLSELPIRDRREKLDRGANLYRLYHPPAIYKPRFGYELIGKPDWAEAYGFLVKEAPGKHPRMEGNLPEKYGSEEFIIDYMAEMVETARQNMVREEVN